LFVLLYLSFFAIGGVLFWGAYALIKFELVHGSLPYELPSALPFFLLIGSCFLIFKMIGSLVAIQKINRPDLKVITREEYPKLFQLIDDVAAFVEVTPPRQVYLSATVSASVFLQTGFRNMFRPAKKKLEIGLGLFNILNCEELRAVLAHEMGHFSQKPIALNVPVYIIGQSEQYLLQKVRIKKRGLWEDQYYAFIYIFRSLADLLFSRLSKDFVSLSVELEYNADRTAAEYAGKQALVSALLKTSFASQIFDFTLNSINILAQSGKGINDMYIAQCSAIDSFLQTKNSVWQDDFIAKPLPDTRLSKLTCKRIERLKLLSELPDISTEMISSKELLTHFEKECVQLTAIVYKHQFSKNLADLSVCPITSYQKWITKYFQQAGTKGISSVKEAEIEISLDKRLRKAPLLDGSFYVYFDGQKLGTGHYKKEFSFKTKTNTGKHYIEIEGSYIIDIKMEIEVDKNGKYKICLDYKHRFWKAEYQFFIKNIEIN
jgi:Zn-dependent protease with chaperone function